MDLWGHHHARLKDSGYTAEEWEYGRKRKGLWNKVIKGRFNSKSGQKMQ